MALPKKLHEAVNYSSELFIPELDSDLADFLKLDHEHLDSTNLHGKLKEVGGETVGEGVLLEDDFIDESQFE